MLGASSVNHSLESASDSCGRHEETSKKDTEFAKRGGRRRRSKGSVFHCTFSLWNVTSDLGCADLASKEDNELDLRGISHLPLVVWSNRTRVCFPPFVRFVRCECRNHKSGPECTETFLEEVASLGFQTSNDPSL